MITLEGVLDPKRGFWTYQVTGWAMFAVYDFFTNNDFFITGIRFDNLIPWVMVLLFGFAITVLLRPVYRRIYSNIPNFGYQLLIILSVSIIAGSIWQLSKDLAGYLFHFRTGAYTYFTIPTLNYNNHLLRILQVTFFMSWPMFVWSILYFLIKGRKDYIEEKDKLSKSEILAKDAQLKALRYQINPHFLFNTLISIQGLMYHNTKLADKMLTELSEFLRYSLRYNKLVFVPLEEEIEIVEKYLTIEKIRFGQSLSFQFEISPAAKGVKFLCFLLQPLVENAVKHGMKTSPDVLSLMISAAIIDNWLKIEIRNTGKLEHYRSNEGTGINNVKERLKNAYSADHTFKIFEKNSWVSVIIKTRI